MKTLEDLAGFWSGEGLQHIIPHTGHEFPEGFDVRELLKQMLGTSSSVLEIGCGYGRLCQAFSPSQYLGVDVNASAVKAASEKNPGYRFECITPGAPLPKTDAALIYTVALHVSDEELTRFLMPVCEAASTILIAELMDTRWRRPGDPPVFNRDPEQYIALMADLGFALADCIKLPYARYQNLSGTVADSRITFHVYKKVSQEKIHHHSQEATLAQHNPTGDPFDHIVAGKTAVVVAHPDDEVLWGGGLLTRYKGLDVICCSVPVRDPERVLCFFKAMKLLGHFPILLPFSEQTAQTPLPQLPMLDLSGYDTVITHNAEGEYGHLQHKQVHAYINEHFNGNIFYFGFGKGTASIKLTAEESEKKMAALKCYDNKSSSDGGLPKWDALLKRYNIDFNQEFYTYSLKEDLEQQSACGTLSNDEIRARSDYQIFKIDHQGIHDIGPRLLKKTQALGLILPNFRGARVLDIGCDFGFWSFVAALQGAEVVGLDRSRSVKDLGFVNIPLLNNQTANKLGLNAKFIDYEAGKQWLPFKVFDVVLCMSLYHHIYNVCQDHNAIWYWLSRVTSKTLIWENPIDVEDSVVQKNVDKSLWPFYRPDIIRKAALQYFDIQYEGPALHEPTRVVWSMIPKKPAFRQYQGTLQNGAGGASKTFLFANNRRINELHQILGKTMIPGSLNVTLNENFDWDSHYVRAKLMDAVDRRQGWDGEWAPKWIRLYPLSINDTRAWAMRFEGEHYPLNFVEIISDKHLRTVIGNNNTVTITSI